ncbi:MAG: DUF167 domain-containing protein [Candidatus Moranbacteria bacterium]|nr:DUF167 domain-containing protein [Candidatus Moranbacteria bacterium]
MRIYVRTNPRSRENKVEKLNEGEYKVKLTAPPVDGKANEMLVDLLAGHFNVSKSQIRIVGGKTARVKMVDVGIRGRAQQSRPSDRVQLRPMLKI